MNVDFVWPSDRARAENDELDRVCEYLEEVLDSVQGAEPVGFVQSEDMEQLRNGAPAKIYAPNNRPYGRYCFVYTHAQPAQQGGVPEGWRLVPADYLPEEMENAAVDAAREYMERTGGNCMKTIYKALVDAAPQQSGEWVRCEDRLPTEADADCCGQVWVFDVALGGVAAEYYENVCNVPDYTHWMPTGLKHPNPPKQEGE